MKLSFQCRDIFSAPFDFDSHALSLFRIQAVHNPVYSQFLNLLGIDYRNIHSVEEIPFLPAELFKNSIVKTDYPFGLNNEEIVFHSSGTSSQSVSGHYLADAGWYRLVCLKGFELFYGPAHRYTFLALLPSYLERPGSSLVYMLNAFMQHSQKPLNRFYLHEHELLLKNLEQLLRSGEPAILIGVTYALLDFADFLYQRGLSGFFSHAPNITVMETGGMKGRRKEMIREEVHQLLKQKTGLSVVHSEYGMTELLSQAYSKGDGKFYAPPWMKVRIRNPNDPFGLITNEKTGGVNIIDLASIFSCAFLSTQDLGCLHADGGFELKGRFDNSDVRGCNLMVD